MPDRCHFTCITSSTELQKLSFACRPDLEFITKRDRIDSGTIARLQQIVDSPFARCTYTDAIDILKDHVESEGAKFAIPVSLILLALYQHVMCAHDMILLFSR